MVHFTLCWAGAWRPVSQPAPSLPRGGGRLLQRPCLAAGASAEAHAVTVRPANGGDLGSLVALEAACSEGSSSWDRAQVQEEVERELATVLVAEQGGGAGGSAPPAVIGWAVGWSVPPDELQVLQVAVHPAYRRRGAARRLVRALLAAAAGSGGAVALLEVRAGNAGAIALYRELGFEAVGTRRRYYQDGEDALLMNLDLLALPEAAAAAPAAGGAEGGAAG